MTTPRFSDRDRELLFGEDQLRPGDAVVHFEHGLARYEGTETVELGDERQELTAFVYRNGGKLMLPAEQGQDFWPYGAPADDVTLDRLKTDDWTEARDEMVTELKRSAGELLKEVRARQAHTARKLDCGAEDYATFCEGFGYEATEDQARAIEAVRADLARDVPMDRLLIGDVGFGKTEVSMRALAVAALAGYQAVIVAPTTVLARQHVEEVRARFGPLGIACAELSRLTPSGERDAVLAAIAGGEAQVVVATQAVLSEDVSFADLALVVIDEEQKFGRQQKLALHDLSPGAHVLRMTATPIPRSLAAAEVGLLDVSVVATPPAARKPVETEIGPLDANVLRRALAREVERGGQVYIVCPRIAGAERIAEDLAKDGTEAVLAHGQLSEAELEARMLRFTRGEVPVLISTAIIESGMHNPRANTMIVWGAEMFGLAQLHQLRGRIGRGAEQAHMLLMTEAELDAEEPDEAVRRLRSFREISGIGAGFRIAREDRNIRGFGELDGDEQSGQLSRLGIGLYRHILRREIEQAA
ncbi:helicase-related protein [Roseobacter sp. HKCCA0434]|uniref:helicase-related protein n=1 Tax=Roseobacter sp. HKCCA0434 TaxID=3079297 RepID=UPI0029058BDC|nr:helicase-related protein [Roseobacter sp. HKCCA0434]